MLTVNNNNNDYGDTKLKVEDYEILKYLIRKNLTCFKKFNQKYPKNLI